MVKASPGERKGATVTFLHVFVKGQKHDIRFVVIQPITGMQYIIYEELSGYVGDLHQQWENNPTNKSSWTIYNDA